MIGPLSKSLLFNSLGIGMLMKLLLQKLLKFLVLLMAIFSMLQLAKLLLLESKMMNIKKQGRLHAPLIFKLLEKRLSQILQERFLDLIEFFMNTILKSKIVMTCMPLIF